MANRNRGSNIQGAGFTSDEIESVWAKAHEIRGQLAYDVYGNQIKHDDYGNVRSQYGWEIDHKHPVARKGTDTLRNLQPLQWQENRAKGDTYPYKKQKVYDD